MNEFVLTPHIPRMHLMSLHQSISNNDKQALQVTAPIPCIQLSEFVWIQRQNPRKKVNISHFISVLIAHPILYHTSSLLHPHLSNAPSNTSLAPPTKSNAPSLNPTRSPSGKHACTWKNHRD
eukprot:10859_1